MSGPSPDFSGPLSCRCLSHARSPRQSESRTTRRRDAAGRARADSRGRRLRQDARADHPHRLADPDRAGVAAGLLAVTFTNKAAKEMLARLSAMLPINTRGMWIGTFHGLCNRMLRTHYRDAGLPQTFQILDSADQLSPIKRLMKALNVDDEKYPAKNLQYFINNAKDQGLRAEGRRCHRRVQPQVRRAVRGLRPAMPARRRGRFRRAAAALLRTARAQPAAARALPGALSPHPGRRVPGHQRAAVRLAQAAGRASTTRSSRSATTTSASTRSAAPTSATCTPSSANSTCRT